MAAYKTTAPLLSLPSGASGVSVTPSGVSEGWSDWEEVTASAATGMRVVAILALPGTRAVGNYYEVEIGTGANGVETPVCAARGLAGNNAGGPADYSDVLNVVIPQDVITAGQRVSMRLRQTSTDTTPWALSFQYYARPVVGTMPASTLGAVNVPAGSRLSVTSGSSNVYGSWVDVTTSADGDWTVTNLLVQPGNGDTVDVQIGLWDGAQYLPRWTVKSYGRWFFNADAWQGGPWNIQLRPALGPIPAGTKVGIRAKSSASTVTFGIGLTVIKRAVSGASSNLRMLWSDWTSVTPASGGLANFSAWTTLIASTTTEIAVTGLTKTYPQGGQTGRNLVQIGVGPDGAETVFANCYVLNGTWGGGRFNFTLPYGRTIPAGRRIAIRFAVEYLAGGPATDFALSYQEILTTPDFDNYTDDLVQEVYFNSVGPDRLPFNLVCGTPAWADGPEVAVDTSVPVDRVLTAYMTGNPAQTEYEIDFLLDGAVATTLRMASGCDGSGGSVMHDVLPIPTLLPEGSALTMRARGSTAGMTVDIAPHYTAAPVSDPSARNLLTGYGHTVEGSDNLIAGRDNTLHGQTSQAHGETMTVIADRAVGFGLDGAPHTLGESGTLKIYGDFATTGSNTLDDLAAPSGQTFGVVVDDTGLLASQIITPDVSDATFLTATDESADLPNSRQLMAGTNVSFDDTTPNERTINVSVPPVSADYVVASDGVQPPTAVDNGCGSFVYVVYIP